VIVDSETMDSQAIPNGSSTASGGAGIQAAQSVSGTGAEIVITGDVGPNAYQTLSAAGIKIVTGASGTVREALEMFKRGALDETGAPTAGPHSGMGRGGGQDDMSRGSGRGGGTGADRGSGQASFRRRGMGR
jgi:predicted Fe-Mo cluster-binding NifX family protein